MNWVELPSKLKIYIILLGCVAAPILFWAVKELSTRQFDNSWWIVAIIAILTVPFGLILPSSNSTVLIGDAYIMAIAMMYGTAPCLAATFCHTLLASILKQRPKIYIHKIFFNVSCTVCVAWLYSSFYHKAIHAKNPMPMDVIFCSAMLAATFFLANSILLSIAISWSIKESIFKFWARTCMPLAIDFSFSALVATGSVILRIYYGNFVPLIAAPLVFFVYGYNKLNQTRLNESEKHLKEQEQLYLRTVESLAMAVDAKDQTTYGHIRRVRAYAIGLAKFCGITDNNEIKAINTGALLHDVGKLIIPDYILNKPGRLTKQEFEKVKLHSMAGDEILQQVRFPFPVAKYVRSHHERWDGNGYPDGLKCEEIPLGARILAIADAFDAIRFSRPYKLSMATDEALDILRSQSGAHFDPTLVRLFEDHIMDLEQAAIQESQNAPELSFRKYFETADRALSNLHSNPSSSQDMSSELVQVAELCSTMSGHLDLQDILQIFSRRMSRLVSYSTCVFYLSNDEGRISADFACGKHSDLLQGHQMEMGMGISGWVTAYGRPMINTEPALDFLGIKGDFTPFIDALVVPIVHGNKCYGTISLYAQKPISYSRNELSTLQSLASLLAPLIIESKKNIVAATEDIVDPTTHLHRIPYLTAIGPGLLSYAENHRSPLSLIYLEIRNLNQIIRIFGGTQGDMLLRRIAECIKPELRETDVFVRYGNYGFIALLPGVRNEQASRCIQRLTQQIRNKAMKAGQGYSIDCRAGVSSYPKDGATVITLLQSAQENLRTDSPGTDITGDKILEFSRRI
jgi:diguanylate cyclase (GGDEF)-like protein/putative nucleotidyltransferase with HDIG domain